MIDKYLVESALLAEGSAPIRKIISKIRRRTKTTMWLGAYDLKLSVPGPGDTLEVVFS
jgi:hypothetical protein